MEEGSGEEGGEEGEEGYGEEGEEEEGVRLSVGGGREVDDEVRYHHLSVRSNHQLHKSQTSKVK